MRNRPVNDLSGFSMLELFQAEAENQTSIITNGLLALEQDAGAVQFLDELMRAAHSLKGAARIVNQESAVRIAHAMEDCFVAAQQGRIRLGQLDIDALFRGVDLLLNSAKRTGREAAVWEAEHLEEIHMLLATMAAMASGAARATTFPTAAASPAPVYEAAPASPPGPAPKLFARETAPTRPNPAGSSETEIIRAAPSRPEGSDRVLRLTAENLNRLLSLAGESLVESRWLRPFADSMLRLKRMQADLSQTLDGLRDSAESGGVSERVIDQMHEATSRIAECRGFLADRLVDLEMFDRRSANLSHRLYVEVLQCRMRPFAEGVRRFPRMVRDLARSLGKQARLEIVGDTTQVDRDILEKLETPLTHLLRNAVDHGCETPEQRLRAGKPVECVIRLEARHSAGVLLITVADDGGGVKPDGLRATVVKKNLTTAAVAEKLSDTELMQFLLLPGFTMRESVTEISGRGVGLDVVHNMVKSVRGNIRIITQPGKGMRFQLQLPLTLSVLRTLLVEVAGEPYAIPLSQISRTLKLPRERLQTLGGRHHFKLDGQQVGLLTAHQVFGRSESKNTPTEVPVVVLGDRTSRYGLIVDRFLGERQLVVQPLDSRLGKIKDISAGSLMEDGTPVLIVDVEDLVHSIDKLISDGHLDKVRSETNAVAKRLKRILAVDDSLTVRELERKLLTSQGYVTEVAVDGMDGWNAVRSNQYDLVITDVDMPRMDGIELATLIKKDPNLKSLPVMIVSYKDREEDRLRGLAAGADYYLSKGSFHNDDLLRAVVDLIGGAEA